MMTMKMSIDSSAFLGDECTVCSYKVLLQRKVITSASSVKRGLAIQLKTFVLSMGRLVPSLTHDKRGQEEDKTRVSLLLYLIPRGHHGFLSDLH